MKLSGESRAQLADLLVESLDAEALGRIDPDPAHERHVKHQTALAHGQAGDVVAAALHRQRHAALASGIDARNHVGDS